MSCVRVCFCFLPALHSTSSADKEELQFEIELSHEPAALHTKGRAPVCTYDVSLSNLNNNNNNNKCPKWQFFYMADYFVERRCR